MQKAKISLIALFIFNCHLLLAQNDCGNNANFEQGNTAGWVCKWGTYGAGIYSGYCADTSTGKCPVFPIAFPNTAIINTSGMNAPLNTGTDRHTIMSMAYNAGGPLGYDSISNWTVPVVSPGGGNYSFRLGDGVAGGEGTAPNRLARAEAIRLTFNVNANNAGFTYNYALFLQDLAHLPEEQPRFEVILTLPDSGEKEIPCGHYKFIAGNVNPYCSGTGDTTVFKYGTFPWRYTDWTAVGLDLSGYAGQNVAVEFRIADCFPNNTVTYLQNSVATTCTNVSTGNTYYGICCWGSPQTCTTVTTCTAPPFHAPGSHSAYAYIEAYCSPINYVPAPVCTGDDSVQICAPPGYRDWVWCTGETAECIWLHNPKPGDSCFVNIKSQAGCPTRSVIRLTGTEVFTRDTAFCAGTSGTVPLTASLSVPGAYTYSWTGPGVSSNQLTKIIPIPTATSTYTIVVTDPAAGCVYVKTMKITIIPLPCINAITENDHHDFISVYPNPSSGNVKIEFGEALQNATIRIFDAIGREVYYEKFSGNQITPGIKLKSGIYYARVNAGQRQYLQKIVISE